MHEAHKHIYTTSIINIFDHQLDYANSNCFWFSQWLQSEMHSQHKVKVRFTYMKLGKLSDYILTQTQQWGQKCFDG